MKYKTIKHKYNISDGCINGIVHYKIWKDISEKFFKLHPEYSLGPPIMGKWGQHAHPPKISGIRARLITHIPKHSKVKLVTVSDYSYTFHLSYYINPTTPRKVKTKYPCPMYFYKKYQNVGWIIPVKLKTYQLQNIHVYVYKDGFCLMRIYWEKHP